MIRPLGWKTSLLLSGIGIAALFSSAAKAGEVKMIWKASSPEHPLKSWSIAEIQSLKSIPSREKDPVTGSSLKGPEMSLLIDKTIENLPGEQKAQVDLIILRSASGAQVQVPRWLFIKYPVVLAPQKDSLKLVLPLTSKPKIWEEGLPLNRLQFHEVTEMEFANYHQLYGSLYLKRRMDPLALRGEKIFVQNCTSCHVMGIEKSARKLASTGHPQMTDAPQLKSREMKALVSYLDAFRLENPQTSGASFTGK